MKISGVYENPLCFLMPGPHVACSPGSCKLKTEFIPLLLNCTFTMQFNNMIDSIKADNAIVVDICHNGINRQSVFEMLII